VHDQLVVQQDTNTPHIQQAMEASYQDILRYKVVAELDAGDNFAVMAGVPEGISNAIGKQQPGGYGS
jgi:hypothetical protein